MSSRVVTIVFTDIKGFTERTANSGRDFALKIMARHDDLLKPIIARYEGILIKTIGDAYLLRFDSPTDAVLCALMMQARLREYNATATQDEKIEIRIAINTGEVNVTDNDVMGEPVNVASRVEGITDAGEIWFTEATYLSMNKQEVPTAMVGEFRLKGVPEALRVYRVVQDHDSEPFQRVLAGQRERLAVATATAESISLSTIAAQRQSDTQNVPSTPAKKPSRPFPLTMLAAAFCLLLVLGIGAVYHQRQQRPFKAVEQAIAEARSMLEKRERDEAYVRLEAVAREFPNHPGVEYGLLKFYAETGFNYNGILGHLEQLLKFDRPEYAADPIVLENLEYFVKTFRPADGWPELREILRKRYLSRFRPLLEKALYTTEDEGRVLRYNALDLLPEAGGTIDRFRFFLNELEHTPSVNSEFERQLQSYLAERLKANDPAEVQAIRSIITKKQDAAKVANDRWGVEQWETFNASLTRLMEAASTDHR